MSTASIEVTDTFGGEANYSWVRRAEIDCTGLSDLQLVRRLKKVIGYDGVRCIRSEYGDMIRLDVVGACIVAFITFEH